jgi:branched-chain amino acid transport system ATP-binding protein
VREKRLHSQLHPGFLPAKGVGRFLAEEGNVVGLGEAQGRRQRETVNNSSHIPLLSTSGIDMRFGALVVLDGVNFNVASSEAVGIVGPNGAGKTTLLNILVGAYQPSAGTVLFRGRDVTELDAADRCRLGIARSHQIPLPFSGLTVFENLFVAAANGGGFNRDEAYQRCIDSLELCGMLRLANRRAETLGLLDRKRLELARALTTDPVILLLDEIGGGLTDGETVELVETIKVLRRRGITIVWIEHIVHVLLQVAERLVCMDAGRVIADGEPKTVLSDKDVIGAYLGGSAD